MISETLKYDRNAGIKVALAPLITDTPIVLLSIFLLSALSLTNIIFGWISIAGALFITYMAYENLKSKGVKINLSKNQTGSLRKGIFTNFLNPHPYIFWITIGSPILFKASKVTIWPAVFFITGFYVVMIMSKVIITLLIDKSKSLINNNVFKYILKALGFVLLFFALIFIKDALVYFGVIEF